MHLRAILIAAVLVQTAIAQDWPTYGGDEGGTRYSPLAQITPGNVQQLQVAWTFHTGEQQQPGKTYAIEGTPIVVGGVMYLMSAYSKVFALNAATGALAWSYDPYDVIPRPGTTISRGVAYWSDGLPGGRRRILFGTWEGRLISLDAATGRPDPAFGSGGMVNLRAGLGGAAAGKLYGVTSAPAIFQDLVIVGVLNTDLAEPAAPGDIRAFHVRTGQEVWRFHTVPRPGEPGNETWAGDSWMNRGGANAWSGLSADSQNGLVFAGLGTPVMDFFGGDRRGENLYANSVVALDARTGALRWHFQVNRHDIWDYDLPTFPLVVNVDQLGQMRQAVAQVTKTGHVFLLDRLTGASLFPLEERTVPASTVPGEAAWPAQIFPLAPPPFAKQGFTEADITDISPEAHAYVLNQFQNLRSGPMFTPPSLRGTIIMPGNLGGATWSGASFDSATGILYVNSNNFPKIIRLRSTPAGPFPYDYELTSLSDHEGYPGVKPPWGELTAINLRTGTIEWRVPLGEYPELTARGLPPTGTDNLGGSIVTAGGLVFIAATRDEMFRAFDKTTGSVLWQYKLPAAGHATPSTYEVNGTQYVVIAAGGGRLDTPTADAFVAFALP